MDNQRTILLVEDDISLNRGISLRLEKEGYRVLTAFGMSSAKALFNENEVHLIISDIMLEDGDGITFCRDIRKKSNVFILFLTALDQEIDVVNGYDIGADDYITKPFSLMVLVSKVHALMRRAGASAPAFIASGDIRVSIHEMKVWKKQELLSLSKKEIQLLILFMEHPKQILSREQILEAVWDMDGQFVDDNTVPVNISRLRSKLGSEFIQNIRGMGYIWTSDSKKE